MAFRIDDEDDDREMADINVTPLVDVMLVLLIIFMITAPMLHQGMEVQLPSMQAASEIPIRVDDPLVLTLKQDGVVYLRNKPVHRSLLVEQLKGLLEGRKDDQVFVKGDRNVSYGDFIEVIGLLNAGGIEHIGLVAEPAAAGTSQTAAKGRG
jgi:biopolymer transport protein TolR